MIYIASIVAVVAGFSVGFMAGAVFRSIARPCRHCDEGDRESPYKLPPTEDVPIREAFSQ